MKLTAIQRLDLSDQLDDLMVKASGAKGLDLLDINDQIDDVMTKLGYGSAAPAPEPDPVPENTFVADFLADKFIHQPLNDFIDTLYKLESFVGTELSLDEVKTHSAAWLSNSDLAA